MTTENVNVGKEETKDISVEDTKETKVDVPKEDKVEEKKYTDADIDKIVDAKFAKWQEKKEKEISQAKKLADMNATEKIEYERDELEKELAELRKANTMNEMSGTARSILNEKGIAVEDSLLEILVSDDADKTKANVDSFANMFDKAVEKAVLDKIKNPNEKRGTKSTVTRDEIMSIKDRNLRQEKIRENIHLFEE